VNDVPTARVSGLGHVFPDGVVALDAIDLDIDRGLTALIGSNGSGKSTLLRILAGSLVPSRGTVNVLGLDATRSSRSLRAHIAYLTQRPALDPEMSGAETLELFAVLYGVPSAQRKSRIAQLAEDFALVDHLSRPVANYSGGLQQRLHLAVGLVHQPQLLLLDEPTTSLDPAARSMVWEVLGKCHEQGQPQSAVVATHDLAEAEKNCQTIVLLHGGKILALGSPAEVIAAHARWRMEVEFSSVSPDSASLQETLSALEEVTHFSMRGRRASFDLADATPDQMRQTTEHVLALLSEHALAVVGFHLQPPSLLGAYFNLTGQVLEDVPPQAGGARQTRGAGRHHRRNR